MPRIAVSVHPAVAEEAEAAYDWYAERSLTAAQGFLEEPGRAVEVVSETPGRWPQYRAGTRRYIFPRFPYFLVYRLLKDQVEVVAVLMAAAAQATGRNVYGADLVTEA